MYEGPETGGGRRPRWRVFYFDGKIIITSWYVEVDGVRIAISELGDVELCLTYRYPIVKVAAVMCGVEAVISVAFAAAYGSAWMIVAGLVSAATVTLGAIADYRKNPRFMSIEATIRGRRILLFRTRDRQRFDQVRRAMIRAVEDSRCP